MNFTFGGLQLSVSDSIALLSLVFTVITTLCALFIAFLALRHTARPAIRVRMLSDGVLNCGEETVVVFEFWNEGHWFGSPTAVNVTAFFNFAPAFELLEINYGSAQEFTLTKVRIGVGGMKFLKAKRLKLSHGEDGERVHVRAITPAAAGEYLIRVSAYSENDADLVAEFNVSCRALASTDRAQHHESRLSTS